ncbi:MAG: hypothetical protein IJL81_06650, partial [Clostridia bacterium]|nr:hypothetical protein [Clostridia bacterium]
LTFETDKIDAQLVMGLDRLYPKRIKLYSGEKPVVGYALRGQHKEILNIVNNLLTQIKELQNPEK